MTEVIKSIVRAEAGRIEEMMRKAGLKPSSGDAMYGEVYINVGGGEARFLASRFKNRIVSYSTFGKGFLESVKLEQETIVEDSNGTVEAIIYVDDFINCLSKLEKAPESLVDITFYGNPNERLCNRLELCTTECKNLKLPKNKNLLDQIPFEVFERFDDNHSWTTNSGKQLATTIEADSRDIRRIINIVENDMGLAFYPVTVRDSNLYIDTGESRGKNAAWGRLRTNMVDGPDLTNYYREEFEQVFSSLSGEVRLETEQDMPLCVVQEQVGQVVRHVLAPVDK